MGMLDNQVAFITGAASGIGAETARRFAQEGARVALSDIQREQGESVRDEIIAEGGRAIYLHCDVTSPESVQKAIEGTVEEFGQLDIVFANAGVNGVFAPIEELQPHEWGQTLGINLTGTYLTVHFAVPHLKNRGGGSILITSSVNGNRNFAYAGATAYCTSKAAQVTFMKMIALELGRHQIRCNAICPGAIPTNIGDNTVQRNTHSIGIDIRMPNGSPAVNKGWGKPRDVANTCLFLASDLGSHISGVEIYVDGGASLV